MNNFFSNIVNSPSLIALSSKDPILTAFELSWELRRLSVLEHEFKSEYLVTGNTKGGRITVLLTSCLTGLD